MANGAVPSVKFDLALFIFGLPSRFPFSTTAVPYFSAPSAVQASAVLRPSCTRPSQWASWLALHNSLVASRC